MYVPTEVVADGKAKILSTVNSFKGVTMESVYGVSLVSFVGDDVNDLTFFWVELHLPLSWLGTLGVRYQIALWRGRFSHLWVEVACNEFYIMGMM